MLPMFFALAPARADAPHVTLSVGYTEDNPPWDCDACTEAAVTASASSTLTDSKRTYAPALAVDHNDKTAWCEGVKGDGLGEWMELKLAAPRRIVAIDLIPFYAPSQSVMFNNGRVTGLKISVDGNDVGAVTIADPDRTPWGTAQLDYPHPAIVLSPPVQGSVVRLTVAAVKSGDKYQDTCISSVGVVAQP
ncbi:MAG: discoidin domain-containing protein [Pseudomonadota bacterium]|nr:discoidin domain-containing protein [Pseudomonadota bacterium]